MKSRKIGFVTSVGVALLCFCLFGFTSKNQTATVMEYGPEVNGLQLSISLDKSNKDDSPAFLLTLRNARDVDALVNLGAIVGRFQSPNAFHLSVKDEAGNVKELDFVDLRYSGIAGRVDNYVVPLRKGSSYSLNIPLKEFWPHIPEKYPFKLKPGKYQIYAYFVGEGLQQNNMGDQWMTAFSNLIWEGKLQSNTITFQN